ncbi:MAG: hypothetical protein AB7S74_14010 [Hyphomicrobium sp.]
MSRPYDGVIAQCLVSTSHALAVNFSEILPAQLFFAQQLERDYDFRTRFQAFAYFVLGQFALVNRETILT